MTIEQPVGGVFDPDWPWWERPPANEMPAAVCELVVLAQQPDTSVFLSGIDVYSTGIDFDLVALLGGDPDGAQPMLGHFTADPQADRSSFSVEYADGSRASSEDGWEGAESPPRPLILTAERASAGPPRTSAHYFLWPLPPPGTITFRFRWPAQHVAEQTTSIDAVVILDAVARTQRLWTSE